ncbi:MAG: hypothetical protein KJ011_10540 [Burkholderiaceae bacterium]|nr:hypothetical protein [Burkholderiaceae bacterium]
MDSVSAHVSEAGGPPVQATGSLPDAPAGAFDHAVHDAAGLQPGPAWCDVAGWQALIGRHARLFDAWIDGAAIGFVPRAAADAGAGTMLAWTRHGGGMRVEQRRFGGFADCAVAVLFVAEPDALEEVHARLHDNALGAMKLQLRRGGMLLYVLAPKTQLLEDGYEDFLEALGLAFMGACR